jgi:hypothetical protein
VSLTEPDADGGRSVPDAPQRPTYARIALATLVGLALGVPALMLATGIGWALRLGTLFHDAHDPVAWTVPIVDAWSLLADVTRLLLVCAVLTQTLALAVRWCIAGWELRPVPVAAAIALAWIPVPGPATLASVVLLVLAVGAVGLTPAPAPSWSHRRQTIAAFTITPLVLAGLAYQPLHPLVIDGDGPSLGLRSYYATIAGSYGSRSWEAMSFDVANRGPAAITLHEVRPLPGDAETWDTSTPSPLFAARGARILDRWSGSVDAWHPIAGTTLAPGDAVTIEIALRRSACRELRSSLRVGRVEARFEMLGIERIQRFDVEPISGLACGD